MSYKDVEVVVCYIEVIVHNMDIVEEYKKRNRSKL